MIQICVFCIHLFAAEGGRPSTQQVSQGFELSKIFEVYRKAKLVEMNVQKTIKAEWKTKDQTSDGKIFYSKGKFRYEIETPEKIWTIYNGKTLWVVQFASPDFPGKNKVTQSTITKQNRDQILLMSLIDTQDLTEKFKIENIEKNMFKLSSKEKDSAIRDLKISIQPETSQIQSLSFKDEVGNTINLQFQKIIVQPETNLFEYRPTKNDEVTKL